VDFVRMAACVPRVLNGGEDPPILVAVRANTERALGWLAAGSGAGKLFDAKLVDVPAIVFLDVDAGHCLAILQFPEAIRDGFFVRPQSRNSDGDWKDEPEFVFDIVSHAQCLRAFPALRDT